MIFPGTEFHDVLIVVLFGPLQTLQTSWASAVYVYCSHLSAGLHSYRSVRSKLEAGRHLIDIYDNFDLLLGHAFGGEFRDDHPIFVISLNSYRPSCRLLCRYSSTQGVLSNAYASMELLEEGFKTYIWKHRTLVTKHVCTLRGRRMCRSRRGIKIPQSLISWHCLSSYIYGCMVDPYYFKIAGPLGSQSSISHLHRISAPNMVIHAQQDEIAVCPILGCISDVKGVELTRAVVIRSTNWRHELELPLPSIWHMWYVLEFLALKQNYLFHLILYVNVGTVDVATI